MKEKILILNEQNKIKLLGRYYLDDNVICFDNVASGIELNFIGTELNVSMKTYPRPRINKNYPMYTTLCVLIDDNIDPLKININVLSEELAEYKIIEDLENKEHRVRILKTDDPLISSWGIESISTDGKFIIQENKKGLNIEVFGDSITSGGDNLIKDGKSLDVVPGTGNGMATYATFTALALDVNINVFSRCGICLYPASSYDTEIVVSKIYNKVSPLTLKKWDLKQYIPDIIVISLGTNDELGNQFTILDYSKACVKFVQTLEKEYKTGILYIFTFGYMNKNDDIKESIMIAVNELTNMNINACSLEMPKAKIGHPTVEEHLIGATLLKDLIVKKISVK